MDFTDEKYGTPSGVGNKRHTLVGRKVEGKIKFGMGEIKFHKKLNIFDV